jgi:transposase
MEACAGAHHWARVLGGLGHTVRLMPPQFVKPYVKSNKNDARDAEAICEAVTRPSMRFVPIKGTEQQAVLMMHRVRQLLVRQRTMVANAIRAHLAEFGIVIRQGVKALPQALPSLLQEEDTSLPPIARSMLALLSEQLRYFSERVSQVERELLRWHRASEPSRRLEAIGGVGPITATAIVASVGDARSFRGARQFAAWLGLVPVQHSSGGKQRLGSISKRGDTYLRTLLIHGARSSLRALRHRISSRRGLPGCSYVAIRMWSPWPWHTSMPASSGRC